MEGRRAAVTAEQNPTLPTDGAFVRVEVLPPALPDLVIRGFLPLLGAIHGNNMRGQTDMQAGTHRQTTSGQGTLRTSEGGEGAIQRKGHRRPHQKVV